MAQEPIQVVVECEGGLVRTVYCSVASVEVHVVDWDAAEGFRTQDEYRASEQVADPDYFERLLAHGVLRPAREGEERRQYAELGLTVDRDRTPHAAW
jgi:hypothetical protein